jgi:hypothetical protein
MDSSRGERERERERERVCACVRALLVASGGVGSRTTGAGLWNAGSERSGLYRAN